MFKKLISLAIGITVSMMSSITTAKPLQAYPNAKAFADAYFEVWNQRNYATISEFYDADVVYRDLNLGTQTKGLNELERFIRKAVTDTPDLKFIALDAVKEGNQKLAIRWQMTGTSEGKGFEIEGASIMRLRKGKVVFNSDYYK